MFRGYHCERSDAMIKPNKTGDISVIRKYPKPALLLSLCLLFSTTGTLNADEQTTVYKAVSKDGSVSFSDEAQKGSEAISVKPLTTIPAIDIKKNRSLRTQNTPTAEYYQSLSIISPANETAFNTGSGDVQVVVQSEPRLRNGDLFVLELDGTVVATQQATTFNLLSVDRGTHTLLVKIINKNQQALKVAISTMTVHRPIQKPSQRPAKVRN